ncbi:MAG TPA: hypothetical protein VMO26_01400 [Vicinamibacterales bacterium]|nr:hypothetical protein [Vicinamibacterales bacterium]
MWRVVLMTVGFICAGAVQGALIGILSFTPVWIEQLIWQPEYPLFEFWTLLAMVLIGAPMGAILGPVIGWILIGRAPLWRILAEPTIAAIIWSWGAWVYVFLVPVSGGFDLLVLGAFLGAIVATVRLRFRGVRPRLTPDSAGRTA